MKTKKPVSRIKTNIKFYDNLNNVKGKLYGFITKENGSWKGCRSDKERKKIVLLDPSISNEVIPNSLYYCSVIPMVSGNGFVATSAKLVRFEADIITACNEKRGLYFVKVKFGNKNIIFDPTSTDRRKQDIKKIAEYLKSLPDLQDAYQVSEDFVNNAFLVQRYYNQYMERKNQKKIPSVYGTTD